MRFLVDNQLPATLARWIAARGHQVAHVLDIGLAKASDSEIFRYAELESRILITKDEDFLHLALLRGFSPGLIWVRLGNCRTPLLLESFERAWPRLEERLAAGDKIIEIR